ncbi:hypothetical protein Q5P01_001936 [Channa striata]|uniref:Uncharacterized protein n=1 Tax=Channa striata TaxID=64152 RepID=A0AA88NZP6_CHASR|nr:hypothetical protein Q5P01_001936 [Channa striata]
MTPQLYITAYKEQFASPGRVKRAQLRPTSAHRRNNPQPRPDFLFPRSLQSSYRAADTQPHPSLPVDRGRPLFPPVRHLSFHSPLTISPGNCLNTVDLGGPQHMPPVNSEAEQALPSADRVHKLHLTEPDAAWKNSQSARRQGGHATTCLYTPLGPFSVNSGKHILRGTAEGAASDRATNEIPSKNSL